MGQICNVGPQWPRETRACTGTSPKSKPVSPTEPNVAELKKIEERQMSDHQVMTLLLNSIEQKIGKMFLFAKDGKELWDKLKLRFG